MPAKVLKRKDNSSCTVNNAFYEKVKFRTLNSPQLKIRFCPQKHFGPKFDLNGILSLTVVLKIKMLGLSIYLLRSSK